MTIRHCMFDFDGTLVDTLNDVIECLTLAFEKAGVPVGPVHVPTIMQLQLREAIASIVPSCSEDQVERVVGEFRKLYDASSYPATLLMPGVVGLLAELRSRSIGRSIVSNKRHIPTLRILDKFGIREEFDAVYNPDMVPGAPVMTKSRMIGRALEEQRLVKEQTLYIGDSEIDVIAADENRIASVIVTGGYGKIDGFKRRPTQVVRMIADIVSLDGLFAPPSPR